MKFNFRSGQQPLPGYTIKRGIGVGGFGEVYFAVTEGGKEVALKWIRSNFEIEKRGIQQCLNLKHPNLVHLYDVRTDLHHGNHWLVMEYVAGEPLSTILSRHPNGVAPELAAQWFGGLAQAIHCLHEHGIVHRDLKPGNIFLENGLIKVGDYGLCKHIADSQHVGMTRDVGTVHYMAPEISTGNYNRQIDIYAAGILLYEMLTGHVPFEGESAGEILMKHLTAPPDLRRVSKEFVPILEQALAKNPANRYQTIHDMAKQVAAVVNLPQAPPFPVAQHAQRPALPNQSDLPTVLPVTPTMIFQQRWSELTGILLASVAYAAVLTMAWTLFVPVGDHAGWAPIFCTVVAASWAILASSKLWPPTPKEESWTRRLMLCSLGLGVAVLALWVEGYELPVPWNPSARLEVMHPWQAEIAGPERHRSWSDNTSMSILACYLSYFGLMFLMIRWWKSTETQRAKRFSLKPLLVVGFLGYLLMFLLPASYDREIGYVSMLMTAVVCQLSSPWKEAPPVRKKKLRLAMA
jgi:serine/threonine protein kinase